MKILDEAKGIYPTLINALAYFTKLSLVKLASSSTVVNTGAIIPRSRV
jgi:hypothetical protein